MAEVSEKSSESAEQTQTAEQPETTQEVGQQPDSTLQKTSKQPAEQTPAPEPEPAQPPAPQENEETTQEPLPAEIAELDTILELLRNLTAQCEETLHYTAHISNQGAIQDAISEYAQALGAVPKSLQLLNDYRRHGKRLEQESGDLQKRMIQLRGGEDDALTSEEIRVLEETKAAKPNMIEVIGQLENVLQHIRNTTHPLLSLVHYDRPGFAEFATNALREVRIDWVSQVTHQAVQRISTLRADLAAFHELIDHANGLENVSETA